MSPTETFFPENFIDGLEKNYMIMFEFFTVESLALNIVFACHKMIVSMIIEK